MSERQPTLSRRRRVWCLAAAALAMLLGVLAGPPAAAAPGPGPAPLSTAVLAVAPASGAVQAAFAAAPGDRGPVCDPGAPGHGGAPAVPARAGADHAQAPAARPAPEEARPHGTAPVRVPVRGPDRPAPGPVELSVLRV
ncbi:hypothetical protein [Streptomyces antarcticus]|uniref:hypothetical protein n=1 Tax=Streptomyces antarcticus TaxID=2996458 RepID=UPI00226D6617|nr:MULTISPECIES: hypothetical protein [unclassified Streptomyces]MCY0944727.1 hypothetical protein [Streptomyces sp. H34-AA3]MCY0951731.1 hypothetical protein [Streptomyces sp. H27-S2]MCZ4085114.1 hypothetical protein [Streptomyces sp. H34-S5]